MRFLNLIWCLFLLSGRALKSVSSPLFVADGCSEPQQDLAGTNKWSNTSNAS
jgi:hypothetical protein